MNLFEEQHDAQRVGFLPARAIESFTAYVTVEESATDTLVITEHPVQTGAAISDHAFKKPVEVKIKGVFDPRVTREPLTETYRKLKALQLRREPFTVVTGKAQYENMLFAALFNRTDEAGENVLAFEATLQEVIIVDVQTVTVPARAKHANPNKTGGKSQGGQKALKSNGSSTGTSTEPSILERRLGGGPVDDALSWIGL